jgi:hypothetical protein
MMTERWLPIIGFEDCYLISDHGNVRRVRPWRRSYEMKPCSAGAGYVGMKLRKRGKRWQTYIHILVALHFVEGRTEDRNEVNHKDGDKTHNHFDNLEWVTRKENNEHKNRVLESHHNQRTFIVTFPDDSVEVVRNMSMFCELNSLKCSAMAAVARGHRTHHKNFKVRYGDTT